MMHYDGTNRIIQSPPTDTRTIQLWLRTTASCSSTASRNSGLRNDVVRFGAMFAYFSYHIMLRR